MVNELRRTGLVCVDEPARRILAEQRAIAGSGVPEKDPQLFTELLMAHSIKSYNENAKRTEVVFFDRGVVDSIGYTRLFGIPSQPFEFEAKKYRYNQKVFVLSPWEKIYTTDEERKMNFEDTVKFHQLILSAYKNLSYDFIFLPEDSVEVRLQMILDLL